MLIKTPIKSVVAKPTMMLAPKLLPKANKTLHGNQRADVGIANRGPCSPPSQVDSGSKQSS